MDESRAKFEAAPEQDTALQEEVARQFRGASQACEAVRKQIMDLRRRTWL